MRTSRRQDPEWREFEKLVARIEAEAGPKGLIVTSPDRIRCKLTGRLREVDASIRANIGTSEIVISIECRRRTKTQDVTWLEQLATKKSSIGVAQTIAVSTSGFSTEAQAIAPQLGIILREASQLSISDINPLLMLDFVLFWHKRCTIAGVGVRKYRNEETVSLDTKNIDYKLPASINLFEPIFHNIETNFRWSINDMWLELQQVASPFAQIEKGAPPIVQTAGFPYPGNVTVETPGGTLLLGMVFLGVSLWLEPEQVWLSDAKKIEYGEPDNPSLQRVEFSSKEVKDWRISLQIPKGSGNVSDLRTGGNWPHNKN